MLTLDKLTEFYEASRKEMHTLVAETVAPVLARVEELEDHVGQIQRILTKLAVSKFDPNDPAFKRICVLGLPQGNGADERLATVEGWFQQHFPRARRIDICNVLSWLKDVSHTHALMLHGVLEHERAASGAPEHPPRRDDAQHGRCKG